MIKSLFTSVLLVTSLTTYATPPMVDLPSDENIVDLVKFTGQPNFETTAAIVRNDGPELSLMIFQQPINDVRYYLVLDNASLGLTVDGMAGTESSLAVNSKGSLLIKQQNQSVGRNRWERTLTVAYRNGQFSIVGFTFSSYDTLREDPPENCDYNLIKKVGVKDGKKVAIKSSVVSLNSAVDAEEWYTCKGW